MGASCVGVTKTIPHSFIHRRKGQTREITLYWYFLGHSIAWHCQWNISWSGLNWFVWITCIVCSFVFPGIHGNSPETLVCCYTIIFFSTEGERIPVSPFLWNYFPWFSRTLAMFQNSSNQSNFGNCQNKFSLLEFIWHHAFNICSTSSLPFFYFCVIFVVSWVFLLLFFFNLLGWFQFKLLLK